MPVLLLERIPLPSLRTYATLSVILIGCAIVYVYHLLSSESDSANVSLLQLLEYNSNLSLNGSLRDKAYIIAYTFTQEPWCLVTLVNMAYCCLILVGKLIQKIVFGQLRVVEHQHIKDKFWNFVFYKFIFIFGVLNVQEMDEIILWCSWFSVLGFLHILAQLCKDRFEYFSSSPATPATTHFKVLLLLTVIHITCLTLLGIAILVGYFYTGVNTFAFMAAECLLLLIKTLYVIVRYGIHLWDITHEGVWENRAIYVYYSDLLFEMSALSVDFFHHLHMLLWGNIFLSMASLVICMQLRYLFHEFQRRIKRHKNYCYVVKTVEAKFPMALPEELQRNNDDCAICWEKMDTARKLPCGHMFHNACLRSWLEQDTSCPTCRISLSDLHNQLPRNTTAQLPGNTHAVPSTVHVHERPANRRTNHFHFDGSRYVSWWPTLSVEVTHMLLGDANHAQRTQTSQFDNMARQVREVFPDMPMSIILEDLRATRSVELTIENIVDGRVTVPPGFASIDNDEFANSEPSLEDESASLVPENMALFDNQPFSHESGLLRRSSHSLDEMASSEAIRPANDGGGAHLSNTDDTVDGLQSGSGFRFSKSPVEREAMLASRKDNLVDEARRRFLAKDPSKVQSTPDGATSAASLSASLQTLHHRFHHN